MLQTFYNKIIVISQSSLLNFSRYIRYICIRKRIFCCFYREFVTVTFVLANRSFFPAARLVHGFFIHFDVRSELTVAYSISIESDQIQHRQTGIRIARWRHANSAFLVQPPMPCPKYM